MSATASPFPDGLDLNWRRRLPGYADELLDRPDVIGRLDALNEARTPR